MRKALALAVCSLAVACSPSAPATDAGSPFGDIGPRTSVITGVTYDPEAFFFAFATWPPPQGPDDFPPPPATFAGIPYMTRSAVGGAKVYLINQGEPVAQTVAGPTGEWRLSGVPSVMPNFNVLASEPGDAGVRLSEEFPSPPFEPIPTGTYFTTVSLRPLVPLKTYCHVQRSSIVGETGALGALAKAKNVPVTDLLDPAKNAGVFLVQLTAPSPFADFFFFPGDDGMELSSNVGEIWAIDWAPPSAMVPNSSPMGFTAAKGNRSHIGYFAVVLPVGTSEFVNVSAKDTKVDAMNGRPYFMTGVAAPPIPGVSWGRIMSFSNQPYTPDPTADPGQPEVAIDWACLPPDGPM